MTPPAQASQSAAGISAIAPWTWTVIELPPSFIARLNLDVSLWCRIGLAWSLSSAAKLPYSPPNRPPGSKIPNSGIRGAEIPGAAARVNMRALFLASFALMLLLTGGGAAPAGTLGDPRIGFSAERVLVFDGHTYIGRIWSMPGEQRHQQALPSIAPVFILHAGSTVGDILLPQLHTAVEFVMPQALAALGEPGLLGKPVGKQQVNGIATTKYAVDKVIPEGRLSGTLWLSADGIPMRCDGSFAARNGKVSSVQWELRHVRIGPQDAALFTVPDGYSKLSPQAAATLLGLRLAPRHKR